jgi:hypothetical protein
VINGHTNTIHFGIYKDDIPEGKFAEYTIHIPDGHYVDYNIDKSLDYKMGIYR